MQSREIAQVDDELETVACDGGGGALGHPLVYLTFETADVVNCYYCGQQFAKARALRPKTASENS